MSARQPATYRYLYTWRPARRRDGPHHGEEVAGLFSGATPPVEAMAAAWLRFAATGDPNGGDLPPWPPATPAGDEAMEFGRTVTDERLAGGLARLPRPLLRMTARSG